MSYCVYRHFDSDNNLLYVGMSSCILRRTSQHENKEWFKAIRKIEVDHFETKQLALEAERDLIKSELPRHNLTHIETRRPTPVKRAMPEVATLHTHEKRQLKKLSEDSLCAIKESRADAWEVARDYSTVARVIRFIRGTAIEQEIHDADHIKDMDRYLESQERAARKEFAIIEAYLASKSSQQA